MADEPDIYEGDGVTSLRAISPAKVLQIARDNEQLRADLAEQHRLNGWQADVIRRHRAALRQIALTYSYGPGDIARETLAAGEPRCTCDAAVGFVDENCSLHGDAHDVQELLDELENDRGYRSGQARDCARVIRALLRELDEAKVVAGRLIHAAGVGA